MNDLFDYYGFVSGGILNVSPREAFELCGKGAVIVDVREEYLNNFKNFDVPEIVFFPISNSGINYQNCHRISISYL